MGGRRAARINEMFFLQRIRKVIFFIKNPNITKTFWRLGCEGMGVVARASDFFFKRIQVLKKFFGGGERKGELASVSEFVLQASKLKKKYYHYYYFRGGGGVRGGAD